MINIAYCQIDSLKLEYKSKFLVISDYYEDKIDSDKIDELMNTIDFKFVDNNLYDYNCVCIKLTIKNIEKYQRYIYANYLDSINSKKNASENLFNSEIFYDWIKNNYPVGVMDTIKFYEKIIGYEKSAQINCEFLLVYNFNFGKFYRLKGFKINEFFDLYNILSNDIYNKIYDKYISKKIFKTKSLITNMILENIYINDLNLKNLHKDYYTNNKFYPIDKCSCTKRDNFIIITSFLNRKFY